MAYQNIGKPRFYIDLYQYLHAIGEIDGVKAEAFNSTVLGDIFNRHAIYDTMVTNDEYKHPFGLNPSFRKRFGFEELGNPLISSVGHAFQFDGDPAYAAQAVENHVYDARVKRGTLNIADFDKYINYIAILGHNFQSACNRMGGDFTEGLLITPKIRAVNNQPYGGGDASTSQGALDYEECGFVPDNFENIVGFERYQGQYSNQDWLTLQSRNLDGFAIGTFTDGLAAGFTTYEGETPYDSSYPSYACVNIGSEDEDNFRPEYIHIPSISLGAFYDMPHSPNMSLTFRRVYDGIDQAKTRGGASLTNVRYTGPPNWKSERSMKPWTNTIPFTQSDGFWSFDDDMDSHPSMLTANKISRNGRRVWDLSWDMLADSDIMAAYESINTDTYEVLDDIEAPDATGGGTTEDYSNPLLDDNNFYSRVLVRTLGGKLPFIFQPDNTNNNTDQFAICNIKKGSFSFRQKGHKLYNVKFSVEEIW